MSMKINVNRVAFANALGHVSGVIPGRTPKPVLLNAKLEVCAGKATLLGTDEEIAIRYDVPDVECKGNTEVLLPAKRVGEIVRELRDERIAIHVEENSVQIRTERSDFRLPSIDPATYPPVAGFRDEAYFTVGGKALRNMIRKTIFATDPESARYALGGILFEFSPKRLTLVATDSRRLAVIHSPCDRVGDVTPPPSPVVPQKAVSLLERIVPETDDPVHVAIHSPNDVVFRAANATIFSRLVEGRFPRYQDVIPKSHLVSIDMLSDSFLTVVKQAMILTNEESRGVDFHFGKGSVVLASQATDVGASKIELPITYTSDELIMRLDPRFITDCLKTLPAGTQFSLQLSTDEDPAKFTTDDGYTYVIMPLSRE